MVDACRDYGAVSKRSMRVRRDLHLDPAPAKSHRQASACLQYWTHFATSASALERWTERHGLCLEQCRDRLRAAGKSQSQWLAAGHGLFGMADRASGRRRFVERLDRRAIEEETARARVAPISSEVDARCSHLRRGWYWGSQEFAEKLLKRGESTLREKRGRGYHSRLEGKAHDEMIAKEMLVAGLGAAGLSVRAVAELPGSDGRKVAIARAIWQRTTIGQGWLAEHLAMSSAANVSQQMRQLSQRVFQ